MAVNFDVLLQSTVFDFYAVPVTFTPLASQPGAPAYSGVGIFSTYEDDVAALDGSIFANQRTLLDIRESDFAVLPQQGDHCTIPLDSNGRPLGEFEVIDVSSHGGGQTALKIRKYETYER
jgi:hypothetical protein